LIEADLASAGKLHLRNGSPSCFLNRGTLNVLFREGGHFGFQIVAYEIEFVDTTIFIGRMECGFCRRQGEDQPAVARIDGLEPEDVAEEGAVRLGVFAVEDYVSAGDHLHLLKCAPGEDPIKPRSRFVQLCLANIQVVSAAAELLAKNGSR
jgi:hypothetical protein